jgi:hypothetical protein
MPFDQELPLRGELELSPNRWRSFRKCSGALRRFPARDIVNASIRCPMLPTDELRSDRCARETGFPVTCLPWPGHGGSLPITLLSRQFKIARQNQRSIGLVCLPRLNIDSAIQLLHVALPLQIIEEIDDLRQWEVQAGLASSLLLG